MEWGNYIFSSSSIGLIGSNSWPSLPNIHYILWQNDNDEEVYYTEKKSNGWSDPINISKTVTTSIFPHGVISPNNTELYAVNTETDGSTSWLIFKKFQISPDIKIITPNGGENLLVGGTGLITWLANDDVEVSKIDSILYSTDEGITWNEITANLPGNTISYEWEIPPILSDHCKICIVISDGAGNKARDLSDNSFTIQYFNANGFEPNEAECIDHQKISSQGIDNDDAYRCDAENGIYPHAGEWMYKISGSDNNGSGTNDYTWFKIFPYDIPINDSSYLSFWIYVKNSPRGYGHILIDGYTKKGNELRNWLKYGYIIDQSGQRLNPAVHTIPQGQWMQYIYCSVSATIGQNAFSCLET